MSPTTPRHVLRSILHRLKNRVDLVGGDSSSSTTRRFVLERSRRAAAADIDSQLPSSSLHALAQSYATLLADLKERERLYRLDTGAENQLTPKEMSRRAAARSGLLLPELNQDLEEDTSKTKK